MNYRGKKALDPEVILQIYVEGSKLMIDGYVFLVSKFVFDHRRCLSSFAVNYIFFT